MKKQLLLILSALSICCLLSVNIEASDFNGTLQEKGSKAKAKAKIIMSGNSCCQGELKSPGLTGPTGPTGPAGTPSPVHATLAQDGASEWFGVNDEGTNALDPITVPLNEIDLETAKGVTFSAANNSFTLSKGFYTIHFECAMTTHDSDGVVSFRFTDVYLDLNNNSSRIPLSWILAMHGETETTFFSLNNDSQWGCMSGSKLFKISEDDTEVKLMISRLQGSRFHMRFEFPGKETYNPSLNNKAVRITLHKVSDL